MVLHVEGFGEIVDGAVAQPQRDLADGVAVLEQHLTAALQLFVVDVLFRGLVHRVLEQQLQGRPGQREVLADLRDGQRVVDVVVDVGDDAVEKLVHRALVGRAAGGRHGGGVGALEQTDDGLGQQAEHQAVHIGDTGGALPDEGF